MSACPARYRLWNPANHMLPRFAAAFERAVADVDRQCLEASAGTLACLHALPLVARAALGDAAGSIEIERWLAARCRSRRTNRRAGGPRFQRRGRSGRHAAMSPPG
jgi:hypothetical protein